MTDAFHSITLLNDNIIDINANNPIELWIGTKYHFTIKSFYALHHPKYTKNDKFFLRLIVNNSTISDSVRTIPE